MMNIRVDINGVPIHHFVITNLGPVRNDVTSDLRVYQWLHVETGTEGTVKHHRHEGALALTDAVLHALGPIA